MISLRPQKQRKTQWWTALKKDEQLNAAAKESRIEVNVVSVYVSICGYEHL